MFSSCYSRTVRLYCSFVTKELLLSNPRYSFWEEYIVSPLYYCHFHCVLGLHCDHFDRYTDCDMIDN